MNSFNCIGIIGTELSVKTSKNGLSYLRFPVGIGDYNSTTKEKETDWINCIAFGKQAELIGDTLDKGSRIGIHGKLKTTKYERSYGVWVKQVTVIILSFYFCEKKGTDSDWDYSLRGSTIDTSQTEEEYMDSLRGTLGEENDLPF